MTYIVLESKPPMPACCGNLVLPCGVGMTHWKNLPILVIDLLYYSEEFATLTWYCSVCPLDVYSYIYPSVPFWLWWALLCDDWWCCDGGGIVWPAVLPKQYMLKPSVSGHLGVEACAQRAGMKNPLEQAGSIPFQKVTGLMMWKKRRRKTLKHRPFVENLPSLWLPMYNLRHSSFQAFQADGHLGRGSGGMCWTPSPSQAFPGFFLPEKELVNVCYRPIVCLCGDIPNVFCDVPHGRRLRPLCHSILIF